MSELTTLVRELHDDAPFLDAAELEPHRAMLLAAIAAARSGSAPHTWRTDDWMRRRTRLRVLGAVAAAGAAAGIAIVIAAPGAGPSVGPTRPARSGAEVLRRAAYASLRLTPIRPRPDQFVYTRTLQQGGDAAGRHIHQQWLSVSGTRPAQIHGVTMIGCERGIEVPRPYGQRLRCTPTPAYFPSMPTRADHMGAFLRRTQNVSRSDVNDLAKTADELMAADYLTPPQQAALLRFLAATPGIRIARHVKDVAGRRGVGVVWSFDGSKAMLVFDPRTYAYLGMTTLGPRGQLGGDALLGHGIVSRAGQVPVNRGRASGSPAG